jgi:hypothetical protein
MFGCAPEAGTAEMIKTRPTLLQKYTAGKCGVTEDTIYQGTVTWFNSEL